jgi:hypothetical protein
MKLEKIDTPPNTITFNNYDTEWAMRITADRKIEVNPNMSVDETAKAVLNAVQELLLKNNPKPVAFMSKSKIIYHVEDFSDMDKDIAKNFTIPLYTAPRELSDEEIIDAFIKDGIYDCINDPYMQSDGKYSLDGDLIRFARAILKKASEK